MSTVRTLTPADAAFPGVTALRDVALVVGASLVTALAAQVAVPLPGSPVPLTGQTFAVLLTGAALGARRAFLAQTLYLLQGAAGLPVFAGGLGGAWLLAGPAGGYLAAFPLAAAVTGALAGPARGAGVPGRDRRFALPTDGGRAGADRGARGARRAGQPLPGDVGGGRGASRSPRGADLERR